MKFASALALLSSSSLLVEAFPAYAARNLENITPEGLTNAIRAVERHQREKRIIVDPSEPIDITGDHAFQAPGDGDQRGPCPGLNVLANHGYISRDGITSLAEVTTAINQGASPFSRPYVFSALTWK